MVCTRMQVSLLFDSLNCLYYCCCAGAALVCSFTKNVPVCVRHFSWLFAGIRVVVFDYGEPVDRKQTRRGSLGVGFIAERLRPSLGSREFALCSRDARVYVVDCHQGFFYGWRGDTNLHTRNECHDHDGQHCEQRGSKWRRKRDASIR